jgi:hypothetical protein
MSNKYETPYDRMNRKNREAERVEDLKAADKKAIAKVKPGAPYYQPEDDAPDRALTRAKAQAEYMKKQSGDDYQRDEGVLADTSRTLKNLMAGKRGMDAMEYGDEGLMAGARKAGREAVMSEAASELQRETRGKKAGGTIRSASSRADGIATKGKTRGKIC